MSHDVFISYSSKDKAIADAVCAKLESNKIRCWIAPRDILPGMSYGQALVEAIKKSRMVVLVLSSNSNISQQVMREIERAVSIGIPIIPLRIENILPSESMEYYLSSLHWLDAITPPIEQHLDKLRDTVMRLLGENASPEEKSVDLPPAQPVAQPNVAEASGISNVSAPGSQHSEKNTPQRTKIPKAVSKSTPPARKIKLLPMIIIGLIGVITVIAFVVLGLSPKATRDAATPTLSPELIVSHSSTDISQPIPISTDLPTREPTQTLEPKNTPSRISTVGATSILNGMEMVYIPEGSFLMGSLHGSRESEFPQHLVYLDSFWINKTEVTNLMFLSFVSATNYVTDTEKNKGGWVFQQFGVSRQTEGADWKHPSGPSSSLTNMDNHPVVQVSWNDAKAFCEWSGARLPSEAEWEKAARGSAGQVYPWGDTEPNPDLLNFDQNVGATSIVGQYPSDGSSYGVLDMAGNVSEWVSDWYSQTYYSISPANNPLGPLSGDTHVTRGGAWFSDRSLVHSAIRFSNYADRANDGLGFRCARIP